MFPSQPEDVPGIEGPRPVLPVSLFVSSARLLLERHLGLVWVSGEVSACSRAVSGHLYFTLKDANAQVRCVFFRSKAQHLEFTLKEGLAVEVRATPSIYEARGEFQLNVDRIRLAGLGALYEKFARLKARLETAGWFAPERKRALPAYPRRIGIVTSLRAAALRDVLITLQRRWCAVRVTIYPASVQGEGAANELAAAIRLANARSEVEVLLVCRGGGSLEDLWCFNEEVLARALFESRLPVVSGVGHETDFTICDFVADVRAATPTGAAMLLVPDARPLHGRVEQLARRMMRAENHILATRVQRVDGAARRLTHPAARLAQQGEHARRLAQRLQRAWKAHYASEQRHLRTLGDRYLRELRAPRPQQARVQRQSERWRTLAAAPLDSFVRRVDALRRHLDHLNPERVLARGYAIVADRDGKVVTASTQVRRGDPIGIALAQGRLAATVTKSENEHGQAADPARDHL